MTLKPDLDKNKLTLIYNILNNGTIPCLRDFFSARSDNNNNNNYNLRNYDTGLSILKPKKEFLREVLGTKVLFYGTVFLMKLKLLNRYILSKG